MQWRLGLKEFAFSYRDTYNENGYILQAVTSPLYAGQILDKEVRKMKKDTTHTIRRAEHFKTILTGEGFLVGLIAGLVVQIGRASCRERV